MTITGSVEIMIALGVADAIVDLVETGSTLAANQLRVLDDIGRYETILIQNCAKAREAGTSRPRRAAAGRNVVIARSWSLLECNVPRSKLKEAEVITPRLLNRRRSGSVEEADWCAREGGWSAAGR